MYICFFNFCLLRNLVSYFGMKIKISPVLFSWKQDKKNLFPARHAGCGGERRVSAVPGVLQSVDTTGNGKYEHHQHCIWTLEAPVTNKIMLRVANFSLERAHKKRCSFDYVEVSPHESSLA